MKYTDNSRSERKENKDLLSKKARKNFRKDLRKRRDDSKLRDRKERQHQKLENDDEFLNTGTDN